MKKTKDGRRLFSREFKIAAVRRVQEGEELGSVARDLGLDFELLWRWKKIIAEKGEKHLHDIGKKGETGQIRSIEASQSRRIAELERLVGRQQMEIGFLERALRQVEEQRQEKRDDGEAASSKE